ncbi:MAG: hypothetical protein LBJ11_04600 [Oscillospiraceae bacterium]|nr:hypothetical protein [Oscillospiraceae bacterium]
MKRGKRILALLLAVLMLSTTLVFSANARAALPGDAGYNSYNYDKAGKLRLTSEQYATMALDAVDNLLKDGNMFLDLGSFSGGLLSGTIDLRSIDGALGSLFTIQPNKSKSLWDSLSPLLNALAPQLMSQVNVNAVKSDNTRRKNISDVAMLTAVFQFLKDNAGLVSNVAYGVLKGGPALDSAVGSFLSNLLTTQLLKDFDVLALVKGLIWDMAYPDTEQPANLKTIPLDSMVEDLIKGLLSDLPNNADDQPITVEDLLGTIPFTTSTAYELIDTVLPGVYTKVLEPLLRVNVLPLLEEAAETNNFKKYLKPSITLPAWSDLGIGTAAGSTIFQKLNHVIYAFVNSILDLSTVRTDLATLAGQTIIVDWEDGGNEKIIPNLLSVGKAVLALFGEQLFPGATLPAPEEILTYTDPQAFAALLARTIVNSVVDTLLIPDSADTLTKVLNEVLIQLAATTLPGRYTDTFRNYTAAQKATTDASLELASDYLVKLLYPVIDTEIPSGFDFSGGKAVTNGNNKSLLYTDNFDTTFAKLINWVVGNYGGLLDPVKITIAAGGNGVATASSAWQTINNLLFGTAAQSYQDGIIDPTWLPQQGGSNITDLQKLLLGTNGNGTGADKGILGNLLNLDVDPILSLLDKRSGGGLNQTVAKILIGTIVRVINVVLPNTVTWSYDTIEGLLDLDAVVPGTSDPKLKKLLFNLLDHLGGSASRLIPTILPVMAQLLGLTKEASYQSPSFNMPKVVRYANSSTEIPFTLKNESGGIPRAIRYPYESTSADTFYTYKLRDSQVYSIGEDGSYALSSARVGRAVASANPISATNTVEVAAGATANLKVYSLSDALRDKLLCIVLTYDVYKGSTTSTAPVISGVQTRIYTYLAPARYFMPDPNVPGEYIFADDANRPAYKIDQQTDANGYAYYLEAPASPNTNGDASVLGAFYINQNVTMADLPNRLTFTLVRPADVDTTDPPYTAVHTATASAYLEPGFDPQLGPLDAYYELDYENCEVSTDQYGGRITLKPLKLREDIDCLPTDKVIDVIGEGSFDARFLFLAEGTKPSTVSTTENLRIGTGANPATGLIQVYDDWGLPGLVGETVSRDPQKVDYNLTNKVFDEDDERTWIPPLMTEEDAISITEFNGQNRSAFFDEYIQAFAMAAWLVYKPLDKSFTSFTQYGQAKENLRAYSERLDFFAETAINDLKGMVERIKGDTSVPYDDPNYTYFGAADFTYQSYQRAMSALGYAEGLIAQSEDPSKLPPSFAEVKYALHRLKIDCDYRDLQPQLGDYVAMLNMLPTAAFQGGMFDAITLADTFAYGGENKTPAQLTAAVEANPNEASYFGLDGDSVRALAQAYRNATSLKTFLEQNYWEDIDVYANLGILPDVSMNPTHMEYGADEMFDLEHEQILRVPQSRLDRAHDELIKALKHVVAYTQTALDWSSLETELAASSAADYSDLLVFNPIFASVFADELAAASAMYSAKSADSNNAILAQTASLHLARKRLVTVVPQAGGFVFDEFGNPSQIKVDLSEFDSMAEYLFEPEFAEYQTTKQLLDGVELYLYVDGSDTKNPIFEGYLYGLDITMPNLEEFEGDGFALPYKVLGGTAEIVANKSGNTEGTGTTVIVYDVDGEIAFKLKVVYFGDPDGNGQALGTNDYTLVSLRASGKAGSTEPTNSPMNLAMDIATCGSINAMDATFFKSFTGKRCIQSYPFSGTLARNSVANPNY